MSDFEKFEEGLPSKDKFYSSLAGKKISDEDYKHVLKVWNEFKMKAIIGYHNLYLNSDILLLVDLFEKFKNNGLKNYLLCHSHYLSATGLS